MASPEGITARWLKWIRCRHICLLALQEAESYQIKLVIEGYHSIDILINELIVQDMHVSDDLSRFFVLDYLGILSSYTADWNNSRIEYLWQSLRSHKISALKEEKWKAFVGSVHKYGSGMKWAVDKLRATEPSGQIEPAILALALLTVSPDHDHLNRLKQSTTTRDAYKYRDQLVRCYEDMREKFEALGLGVKESEPYSRLLENIEKQLKDFLAWFLSRTTFISRILTRTRFVVFSANSDNGKVSLSTIVEALTCKDLNSLRSLTEASLKKESASISASAASMEHLKQIRCTLIMQEQMHFDPPSGLVGALRSGTVAVVGLDQTKTRVHLWKHEDGNSNTVETTSRLKSIKSMTLTTDHAVMLVFQDGSVKLLDLSTLASKQLIEPNQLQNTTSNHIKILFGDSGLVIVL